ncbi:PBP1A family penicillin-binding protein [Candidatus Uhrbacteria bacterium]|nr:PBP1A family penicillin-binding protein [Candidatus Uhrbacteria bacterium]
MPFTIKPIRQRRRRFLRRFAFRRLAGPLITVALFMFLGGALSLAMLTAWVSRDLPNPDTLLQRNVALSTKIYDRTGTHLLYEIHGDEARTLVKLEEIPEYVKWATIAIEDKNFYKHRGVALRSIARAAVFNVLGDRLSSLILRRPSGAGGASTITQQFVKNAVLSPEKTFARKIRELILSREIERRFTKDQILQLYFNEIPYGRSNYGLEAASQDYFKKSARDLTLAEAATLAALPQAPTSYLNNPDRLLGRRNFILDLMAEQGSISRSVADQTKQEPLGILERDEGLLAPHFVFWVKEQLTAAYGERMVEQGGLSVITSLDLEKQKAAEEAVAAGLPKIEEKGGSNAALVALDPKTGQVLAMVGSRDYFDKEHHGAVNVTLRPRQPGSSFKPIVYTAGFIKGYTPTTILYDVVTIFKTDTKDYTPHNYDNQEHGPVTVRQALAGSLNLPAVKMIYLVGIDRVLDFAQELGYTTLEDRSRFGLSLVLGGGEVTLLEHTSAFATFSNDGVRQEPVAILQVKNAEGKALSEWKPRNGQRVLEEQYSRLITDVLQDNNARSYIFGAQNFLTLPDRPVAAKTGTTNDFRDAWTIGYTPQLAAGVWAGNNDNTEMKRGADGSIIAAPIWQTFMKKALAGAEVESFKAPEAIVTGKPILDGQVPGEIKVQLDRASGLRATELTPANWIEEKIFFEAHSILHFINKDDPRGEPPTDPSSDPQYANWEEAVRRWAAEQVGQSVYAAPPTEFDNLHLPENQPSLALEQPVSGAIVSGHTLTAVIRASAPRGISRVRYIIDGVLVAERNQFPFDGAVQLPETLPRGSHTITVVAFDDIDNSRSVEVKIELE